MISRSKRFIFVHIYKTAGTSVRSALVEHVEEDSQVVKLCNRVTYKLAGKPAIKPKELAWKHAGAGEYLALMGEENFRRFFKFSIVRNPFDWQVSLYEYIRQSPGHHLHNFALAVDFLSFLRSGVGETTKPQASFLTSRNGELLVDFVGKFESLDKDFSKICEKIGAHGKLEHLNASTRSNLPEYYASPEAIDIVLENFHRDFNLFGYPKSLP